MTTTRTDDVQNKLKLIILELKKSKILNEQLLREREESELEVENVIKRNTHLKQE